MPFDAIKKPPPPVFEAALSRTEAAWATWVPLVADVSWAQLQRLRCAMALLERRRVNVARMGLDRRYALQVLATAEASPDDDLRALACTLRAAYGGPQEPPPSGLVA